MKYILSVLLAGTLLGLSVTSARPADGPKAGNPVFPGRYADPEGIIFGDRYWIFPTCSQPFDEQVSFDAFSSPDLVTWTKHERIIDTAEVKWARRAMWAPAILKKGRKYYFFFGANDMHHDGEGGIGVAVARRPEGPYKDLLGRPLIDRIIHDAQPIDQFVFRDQDGTYYMYYGGWRHCNVGKLKDDFTGFVPFEDGTVFKEVTPENYVEGPFMFIRDGKYYFMWSEGDWGADNYCGIRHCGQPPGAVRTHRGDSAVGPRGRDGRRAPFGDLRTPHGPLLLHLPPPSDRQHGPERPGGLHRRDALRQRRADPSDRHHARRRRGQSVEIGRSGPEGGIGRGGVRPQPCHNAPQARGRNPKTEFI